jgi:hypothetical protein
MVNFTLRGTAVALAVPMGLSSVAGEECSRQCGTGFQALWTRGGEAYLLLNRYCTLPLSICIFRLPQDY